MPLLATFVIVREGAGLGGKLKARNPNRGRPSFCQYDAVEQVICRMVNHRRTHHHRRIHPHRHAVRVSRAQHSIIYTHNLLIYIRGCNTGRR
jgi:hypothetical protein